LRIISRHRETLVGTASANAVFNFKFRLNDPVVDTLLLKTINFGIQATPNAGALVPDHFTATFTRPAPVLIDGIWVTFTGMHASA